jgi:hypothetical protein
MKKQSQARRAAASTIRGAVPANYREALYWKITQTSWRLTVVNLAGLLAIIVFGMLFFGWAALFGRLSMAPGYGINYLFTLLAAIVIMLAAHEAVHGLSMALFGARPRFGVLWQAMMLYTTAPGHAFRRNEYVVVITSPFVALSLLVLMGVLVVNPPVALLLAAMATLNAAGAVGDLWILSVVLRYPSAAYVVDEQDGMRIFLPA